MQEEMPQSPSRLSSSWSSPLAPTAMATLFGSLLLGGPPPRQLGTPRRIQVSTTGQPHYCITLALSNTDGDNY